MGSNFEMGTQRYVRALRKGSDVPDAISKAHVTIHKQVVFDAAIEMLDRTGIIDMKQLALDAGISRASLYRYYADKLAVEAEVVGCLVTQMAEATAAREPMVEKLRAAIDVMLAFPAGAAALVPVVAEADPDVIAESCRAVIGHPAATPVLVGFAAMIASAHRRDALDQVRSMADDVIAQFELSVGAV